MSPIYVESTFQVYCEGHLSSLVKLPVGAENLIKADSITYFLTFDKVDSGKTSIRLRCIKEYVPSSKCYDEFSSMLGTGNEYTLLKNSPTPRLKDFFNGMIEEHQNFGLRVFNIIRWQYNVKVDIDLSFNKSISWSLDANNWYKQTYISIISMKVVCAICLDNVDLAKSISDEKINEPLYFNLLREAELILFTSPRSALIMIAASIEVGTKQFIIRNKPELSWIFSKLQSPPIPILIDEYLPELIPELNFHDDVKKELVTIFKLRNELVHKGQYNLKLDSLLSKFNLATDILYYFDRYHGNEWINETNHISQHRLK